MFSIVMLAPTLCVYWTLEYVDISNLPEKVVFVNPAILATPHLKKAHSLKHVT